MVFPQRTRLHARIKFMSHLFTKEGKLSKIKRNNVEQMFTSWYVNHARQSTKIKLLTNNLYHSLRVLMDETNVYIYTHFRHSYRNSMNKIGKEVKAIS